MRLPASASGAMRIVASNGRTVGTDSGGLSPAIRRVEMRARRIAQLEAAREHHVGDRRGGPERHRAGAIGGRERRIEPARSSAQHQPQQPSRMRECERQPGPPAHRLADEVDLVDAGVVEYRGQVIGEE